MKIGLFQCDEVRAELLHMDGDFCDKVAAMLGDFDFAAWVETAGLGDVDNMVIRQPSYFEDFGAMFTDVELQAWKDYLSFRMVNDAATILSEEFGERRFPRSRRSPQNKGKIGAAGICNGGGGASAMTAKRPD